MHQQAHEVSINSDERYVMVRCGDDIRIYDEIPDYCAVCEQAL